VLRSELRLVSKILEAASTARGEMSARRLHAPGPRLDHLDGDRLGMAALHLRDAGTHRVAREPGPHEHHEPVEPRDPVPAVGERVDPELELLVALHRRSHGYWSTVT
jgi:hypothetical protein